jgi:hypothetical protein
MESWLTKRTPDAMGFGLQVTLKQRQLSLRGSALARRQPLRKARQ